MATEQTAPKQCIQVNEALYKYIVSVSLREPDVLRRLREETARHPRAVMQISADQGQFMNLLVKMLGVKRAIEVGVFTGYSSLSVALALPDDGKLIALDVSEEYTSIARRYWKEAKVDHKVDLRLAPGTESLDKIIAAGESGRYDFAFIDADKVNYLHYYEKLLVLLRPGGVIAIDNVLWDGKVANPAANDEDTVAIRKLNEHISKDSRVEISLLPVADGLFLCRKK